MTSYQVFTCDRDTEFTKVNCANKAARQDLDPGKLQIRLEGHFLSAFRSETFAGVCAKRSRNSDLRRPDQDHFCLNPPRWSEQAGSGAHVSPSLHTFTRKCCCALDPINARVHNINSCDDPRYHLAFVKPGNTKDAGSTRLHEATQMEKPFEWMKLKRNQASTGKLESFCELYARAQKCLMCQKVHQQCIHFPEFNDKKSAQ